MEKLFLVVTVSLACAASGLILDEKVVIESLPAAEGTSGPGEGKNPEYYRLPKGVTPLTYELRIIPFLEDGNQTFKGDVTIKLLIDSATWNITLHLRKLNVSEIQILEFEPPKVEIPVQNFHLEADRDFIVVVSQMILAENKTYTLHLKFKGEFDENYYGFYKSSYLDSVGKQQWLATTQFQPLGARMAFPCFDEPHLKANFSISIARPRNMNALSNMNLKRLPVADPSLPDNYVWDHFEETPKMSTYLVAFIVSNFSYMKAEGREFRVWTRKEYINDVEYSLEIGPKVLDVMKNFTGIEYSLPKMDMVALPDFIAGAMENWGLVTYREPIMLFNKEMSSTANKQRTAAVITHELAHQWFGDLVSPEWWTWTWLNEGFATYYSKFAMEMIEPSWRMMEQFVAENLQPALISDSFTDQPMNHKIRNPDDVEEVFDEVTYQKAGSVIRMMEDFLSNSTYMRGLGNYLSERKYNSARDTHLFKAMDAQAIIDHALPENVSVAAIMSSWATQAGHPLITVTRDYLSGRVALKQERFTFNWSSKDNKPEKWWVPISYTTQNAGNFNDTKVMWMKECSDSIQIESLPAASEWILFNLKQRGFYRVNYDDRNWRLLSDYLNNNEYRNIPPVERAMLVDDALNLARAGYLNYSVALNLTSYLHRESDYIPLYSAYRGFSYLETRMSESDELSNFKVHMRNVMKSYYDTHIFEGMPEDDHVLKVSRTSLLPWACKYNYGNCISKATKLFREWRGNSTKSIPSDLKSAVTCFGVEEGGNEDWNYVWDSYQTSSVAVEKVILLKSLGCSRNKTKIRSLLEMSLDPTSGIRKHDISSVFQSVLETSEGLNEAVSFIISKTEKLLKTIDPRKVGKMISIASNRISSKSLAEKMNSFLSKIDEGPLVGVAGSAQKTISRNQEWIDKYGPEIESWLKKKYSASSRSFQVTCSAITIFLVLIHFLIY